MIERTTLQEILQWADQNQVELPPKNRLEAINAARVAKGLRPFVVIASSEVREMMVEEDRRTIAAEPERKTKAPATRSSPPPSTPSHRGDRVISPPLAKQRPENLRDVLFQELFDLRNGDSEPKKSQAVARLAAQIVHTYRIEVEMAKLPNQIDAVRITDDTTN
jgi:hypothetical protein